MQRSLAIAALLLIFNGRAGTAQEVPQGEVNKCAFASSKIFPGTSRDYWIYIPKQYDPAKPACLWVCQDGVQYNAPKVFDTLIASKEMPVTIGVFINPGRVKSDRPEALDRINRSFEYDGLGDAYARFLIDELLPDAETKTATDGRRVRLSRDPNDRAIGGASSGAICAFTAAWERPDAFRRVFSAIGTYVGFRGGNDYPTLIRKTEPKPLRVFLQDGSKDLNNFGGDWWPANQEMERALSFAGYEVSHDWGDGGHSVEHATRVFADAMRWLWKDHPKPINAGKGSQQLQEILIPGEEWQLVAEGYGFTEGPAVNAQGEVFYNDIPGNKTYKIGLDGQVTTFLNDSKRANGQAFGPDGRLYAVATATPQVLAYAPDGKVQIVAEGLRGNDLTVTHEGLIYLTHPAQPDVPASVWRITPQGVKTQVDADGIKYPNGIALSPDQSLLYVADYLSHWVYSYRIAADGSLQDKQKFYHLHMPDTGDEAGADGIRVDRAGRLYVTTRLGLQVCDQPGRVTCIIPTPNGKVANLAFGGPGFDILYATCGDKVYKRKVKVKGANAYEKPFKPETPRL